MADSENDSPRPRVVHIEGVEVSYNDGHGVDAPPSAEIDELHIRNSVIRGNKGSGIRLGKESITEVIGIPHDTDLRQLTELLVQLRAAPVAERQVIIEQSTLFQTWVERGINTAGLAANLATLCDSATVSGLLTPLIKQFIS
jgi:hypothetical protein